MKAVRTALVVEGGGLRGAFPVGVLQVLLARFGADAFDGIFAAANRAVDPVLQARTNGDRAERITAAVAQSKR